MTRDQMIDYVHKAINREREARFLEPRPRSFYEGQSDEHLAGVVALIKDPSLATDPERLAAASKRPVLHVVKKKSS